MTCQHRTPDVLFLIATTVFAMGFCAAESTRPNIVFILADDLGWNDVGFHNPDIKTPHLDDLARSGVILNQSYAQPVCSPSRAALMTGIYPFRLGLQHVVIMADQAVCLPLDRTILPQVLKKGGYATHLVGKWHLGYCNWNCTPTYRGFDSFYGYYNGDETYYSKDDDVGFDFHHNKEILFSACGTYSTYQYGDRVKEIIKDHNPETPLFLYLAMQSVHTPLEVPDEYYNMYPDIKDEKRRKLSGMATAMDDTIGVLVSALKDKGIFDNTLLVFSSDNGGAIQTGSNNSPLRGGKITLFEGGTRVAGLVHGPMLKQTGVEYDGMIHFVDWFPTLVEAAGIEYQDKDQDGVSQWQSLVHLTTPSNRQEIVYNVDDSVDPVQGRAAIRVGDYKLIDGYPGIFPDWYEISQYTDGIGSVENRGIDIIYLGHPLEIGDYGTQFLFNLKDDPTEHVNLYDKHPEIVEELRARLQKHVEKQVPALFPPYSLNPNCPLYKGSYYPGWC